MLVSARHACGLLLEERGIARAQARRLLAAGLAGPGVRGAGAVLYDPIAVQALASRPVLELDELAPVCPNGLVVARLDTTRRTDAMADWQERAVDLSGPWAMPPWTRALLAARITALGTLPWVATLCGHVVLGADAVGVHSDAAPAHVREGHGEDRDAVVTFTLARPGSWFDAVGDAVLRTGRGGRPCLIWVPRCGPPDPCPLPLITASRG